MRLAAIQHDIVWEDRDATLTRLAPQVERAAAGGAEFIVLTEMFATGFSMNTHRTAEPMDGPTVTWMRERAQEGTFLAASVPIDPGDGGLPANRLLVVGDGEVIAHYDKIHPFSHGGEDERFRSGDGPVIVTIAGVRLALTVCYDLRFAPLYWELAEQVDAYLVVASWPEARREHWRRLLRARAIENQAYVVGVNRVGDGYQGDSAVIAPSGETLVSAAHDETVLCADIDAAAVAAVRERYPFLLDR